MINYEQYYRNQVGSGDVFFRGTRIQRGYGLGNILSGLFRTALPILKQGAKGLGKEVLRTGVEIASDGLSGQNVKTAAKARLKQAGARSLKRAADSLGRRNVISEPNKRLKRKIIGNPVSRAYGKQRKWTLDIFDH